MALGCTQPWVLWALPLCLMPLLGTGRIVAGYSWNRLLPPDPGSRALDWSLRLAGVLALAAILLGLAGLHRREQRVERVGTGAHIVVLLDRSSSMNENFSGHYLDGGPRGSKSAVARRILAEFVRSRPADLFGLVAFSSAPVYVTPLTQDHAATEAAIRATDRRGRGVTNIAPALGLALGYFRDRPYTGARVLLLISDGAARIEPEVREGLRQLFADYRVSLYWLYLRTPTAQRLSAAPVQPDESTAPELFLHGFFQTLQVPYRAYETEDPESLARAIADVGRLNNQPLRYFETLPRRDLSGVCYGIAALLLALLAALKMLEVRPWPRD